MSYKHLTDSERMGIFHLRNEGKTLRQIGERLGRHHTTIQRELKRNASHPINYRNEVAHKRAMARRAQISTKDQINFFTDLL